MTVVDDVSESGGGVLARPRLSASFARPFRLIVTFAALLTTGCGVVASGAEETREIVVTYEITEMLSGENFIVRALDPGSRTVQQVEDNTGTATLSIPDDPSIDYAIQVYVVEQGDATGSFCAIAWAELDSDQTSVDFQVDDDSPCPDNE